MAPGSRQDAAKLDWTCQSCVGRDGHPFKNFGSRVTCRECDLAKGACFGKNVAKAVEVRKQGAGTTLAERQLHGQKAAEAYAKTLKKKNAEVEELKAKLRGRNGLEVQAAASADVGDGADTAVEEYDYTVE